MLYPEFHKSFDEMRTFFAGMALRKAIKDGFWRLAKYEKASSAEELTEKLLGFRKVVLELFDEFTRIYELKHRHPFIYMEYHVARDVMRKLTGGGQVTNKVALNVIVGGTALIKNPNFAIQTYAPYMGSEETARREVESFTTFIRNMVGLRRSFDSLISENSIPAPEALAGLQAQIPPNARQIFENFLAISEFAVAFSEFGGTNDRTSERAMWKRLYLAGNAFGDMLGNFFSYLERENRLNEFLERLARGNASPTGAVNSNNSNVSEQSNGNPRVQVQTQEQANSNADGIFELARVLSDTMEEQTSRRAGHTGESSSIADVLNGLTNSFMEWLSTSPSLREYALDVVETMRRENVSPGKAMEMVRGKHSVMFLASPSLTTFAHEFTHIVQSEEGIAIETEKDARMVSHTAYFIASPPSYRDAFSKGRIYHRDTPFIPPIGMGEAFVFYDVGLKRWKEFFLNHFLPLVVKLEQTEDPEALPDNVKPFYGIFRISDLPKLADGIKGFSAEVEKALESLIGNEQQREEHVQEDVSL